MSILKNWYRLEILIGLAIAAVSLVIYILTLCPTVNFIDSGELASVACTLGIAHPTGYPLFTVLAWLFVHLPLGMRPVYQLNLFAAVLCAVGGFVFFRFLVFFIDEFVSKKREHNGTIADEYRRRHRVQVIGAAAFGATVLAFSETYWSQALSIEVYSLHVVFLSLLLLLFTKAAKIKLDGTGDQRKASMVWLTFAYVLGLAFTNHMTTILLAPAFLYLYFYSHGFNSSAFKKIMLLAIPFLIGFSIQLYLPLRATERPLMNWGNPIDFERWFWHFSGKVYRVWIFSSTENAAKQLSYFLNSLPTEFVYFPLVFAFIGMIHLLRYRKHVLVFTLLLFLSCVLYSINYEIHDIDSYFLLAYFTIAIWSAVGANQLLNYLRNVKLVQLALILLLVSCPIIIVYNFSRVDESSNTLVEKYTTDVFKSIGSNGIIISYQWDYFVSAAYYLQLVEHQRTDVVIVDKELLRRTWYFKQLEHHYPWLINQSRKELDAYLIELYKFEHNQPYNPNVIEYRYSKLIQSLIEKNISTRPVYVTHEIENEYTTGFSRVPNGLTFRLYADTIQHPCQTIDFNFHPPEKKNAYVDGITAQYAQAYVNSAIYFNLVGNKEQATSFLQKALEIQPTFQEAAYLMSRIGGGG